MSRLSRASRTTLRSVGEARTSAGAIQRRPADDDLEMRVENRKRDLIAEILEHKKNSSRSGAVEAIRKIEHQLAELSDILTADNSAKLGSSARLRLSAWIAR